MKLCAVIIPVFVTLGFVGAVDGAPMPGGQVTAATDRIVFDGAAIVWVSATGTTSYAGFLGRADGSANETEVDGGPVPQPARPDANGRVGARVLEHLVSVGGGDGSPY